MLINLLVIHGPDWVIGNNKLARIKRRPSVSWQYTFPRLSRRWCSQRCCPRKGSASAVSLAYRVTIGLRAFRSLLSSDEFKCVFMPSHATWADSLGWSHSPMREEAGLSYPAIESLAERPAMGERKKKVLRPGYWSSKKSPLPLYLSSAPHTTPALRQKAQTSQLLKKKVVGFLACREWTFVDMNLLSFDALCFVFCFFTSIVPSHCAATQQARVG